MADSITIMLIIMGSVLSLMIVIYVYKSARIYLKGRRSLVRTPKLRGRNILRSEEFGSAEGIGYEPLGYGDRAIVRLRLRDGQVIAPVFYNSQLVPENPVHAFVGGESSLWYVRGRPLHYTTQEVAELSDENKKLRDEQVKKDMMHKERENEAATLPDEIKDIIRDAYRSGKTETVSVVKK